MDDPSNDREPPLEAAGSPPSHVSGMTIGGVYLDALLILSICLLAARYKRTLAKYDGWLMRGFVIWLLLGSLANSALVLTNAVNILIIHYYERSATSDIRFTLGALSLETAIVWPVEVFYGYRAYCLRNRSKIVAVFLIALLLSYFISTIVQMTDIPMTYEKLSAGPRFIASLATFIATEIIISSAIIWILIRTRSAFTGTQRHIQAVLYLSAQAQLIPTIIEIALLLKTIIVPDYPIIYLILCLPKVWAVSALLFVNSRHSMRKKMESDRARKESTFVHDISSRIEVLVSGSSNSSASRANTERPPDTPIPPSLAYHPDKSSFFVLPVMRKAEEEDLQYSVPGVIPGSSGGSKGDEEGDEKNDDLSLQPCLEES